MTFLYTEREADRLDPSPFPFTAIVPAAGLGTRLGYDRPKILYPILGRPILATLLELLLQRSAQIVLVVSPSGRPAVERALAEYFPAAPVVLAEQREPRGMGDAVLAAERHVAHAHCVVVWGDQVTLRDATLDRLERIHASRENAALTVATIERETPYIHLERDDEGRIIAVHEARNGPLRWTRGENDCGLFAFQTKALFEILQTVSSLSSLSALAEGAEEQAKELNLLPHFPRFERGPGSVATLRLSDPSETLGVNTQEDARRVEELLLQRRSSTR